MYRKEMIQKKIPVEEYRENYKQAAGFLDYCEKCIGCKQIWSCPLYDFDLSSYGKKFDYFYMIGVTITLDKEGMKKSKKSKDYVHEICLQEKYDLSKRVLALEEAYPGSVGLVTGSCHMCSRCTRPFRGGCRYSDEIRCFMESLGAEVKNLTSEFLGVELQFMQQKPMEYFTLINGLLTNEANVEL